MNYEHNTSDQISIIIPTLNESTNIEVAAASIQSAKNIEIIVVDGGSQDNTIEIVQKLGIKFIHSLPGRASQMNAGALLATGNILLFLHADTQLPPKFDTVVREALKSPGVVAGAFNLKINASPWSLRLVEWGVKVRSHLFHLPYGDQAIFIKQEVFEQVGGFPELPIMEDFEMMRRLQRMGRIQIVPTAVVTSARRWLKKGVFKTTLINQMAIIAYFLGVSPTRIRYWYRGKNNT
ncbi:TIGR04283 family arsenosugar biosynthesis glycosyltransferase [Calothrix sp. UHCC 0171]|uniref:TIGR04283 family arsenosugar biosynthesis glycosyltransferase n=1 Tax=Calothrix sp. UHCC 0171 TaxID=3110245 RepID=UPI002B1ED19C|nr:TIGR04283 family arsenosugar biosynthesis glycosyltransferase [Calothrix sp. UHCC 0171]MEA5574268.1 TIGR04283 family arsenosugar biosynthesis glycosyltransferase [Calothrix sp. UHCC 0171]